MPGQRQARTHSLTWGEAATDNYCSPGKLARPCTVLLLRSSSSSSFCSSSSSSCQARPGPHTTADLHLPRLQKVTELATAAEPGQPCPAPLSCCKSPHRRGVSPTDGRRRGEQREASPQAAAGIPRHNTLVTSKQHRRDPTPPATPAASERATLPPRPARAGWRASSGKASSAQRHQQGPCLVPSRISSFPSMIGEERNPSLLCFVHGKTFCATGWRLAACPTGTGTGPARP